MAVEDKPLDEDEMDGKPKRKKSRGEGKRRKTLTIQDEHGVEHEVDKYLDD